MEAILNKELDKEIFRLKKKNGIIDLKLEKQNEI
jgi:hypothetical protein